MSAGRIVALDGVRGIAIVLVVLHHADDLHGPVPIGGIVGVSLFFVLSGYLITGLLLDEHDRRGTIRFGHFYLRRAARLLPALAVLIATLPILMLAVNDPVLHVYPQMATAAGVYMGNVVMANGLWMGPLLHTWSLALEEQFYLVWPACLVALLHLPRRWLFWLVASAAAVAGGHRVLANLSGDYWATYYSPSTTVFALLAGCALAVWLRDRQSKPWPGLVGVIGLVGLVCLAALPRPATVGIQHVLWLWWALPATMFALMLVGAAPAIPGKLLTNRPLVWLGLVSYGWYLWHYALMNLLPGGQLLPVWAQYLAAPLSLLVAWASWRWVEQPVQLIIRRSRRSVQISPAPAPLALVPE
jgi:peptidoglycan/LPS O-acetylase OafA/YrhL